MQSEELQKNLDKAKEKLASADMLLIGTGKYLDAELGYDPFDPDSFERDFPEFKDKFGINSIMEGLNYKFPDEGSRWAFISKVAKMYRFSELNSPILENIKKLIGSRDYFIITDSMIGIFNRMGYPLDHIVEINGNLGDIQCHKPCTDNLYSIDDKVEAMLASQAECSISDDLLPKCPDCGEMMVPHISGKEFVTTDREFSAEMEYQKFMFQAYGKNFVILELGVEKLNRTIKEQFMNLVYQDMECTYITINDGDIYIKPGTRSKSIAIDSNIGDALEYLAN